MTDKITTFFEKMQPLFGPPYKDMTGALAVVLSKGLQRFDEDTLVAAAEHFVLTREFKTWPMPKEIIAACKVQDALRHPTPPKPKPIDYWTDERCEKADQLILCDLGVEAMEGGWLDELWQFCRKHERLPDKHEVDGVFVAAERSLVKWDHALDRVSEPRGWKDKAEDVRRSLLSLAGQMKKSRERREVLVQKWKRKHAA